MMLLLFLFEILDTSTPFVRERTHSGKNVKLVKLEKFIQLSQPDHQSSQTETPTDSDYLTCSAVIPTFTFQALPHLVATALQFSSQRFLQEFTKDIQRPPSRA